MTTEPAFETQLSDLKDSPAPPAERRSWAPSWPSDNFASATPLRKRAIGWRGQLRTKR
jgi:hypothetical protein